MDQILADLGRNNTHQVIPFIDQLAHNPKILDVVQSIIGQNILVAGTTLFIKEPEQPAFISWHQDAKYNGLKPLQLGYGLAGIDGSNYRKRMYVHVARQPH